jgi:hypothetical protein
MFWLISHYLRHRLNRQALYTFLAAFGHIFEELT